MNPIILYDNRFDDAAPTATDTAAGYDVLNIRDWRTYTFWQAASLGTKYITIDCGSAKDVDALGIIGHNLGTAAATVSVESSGFGAWAGEQTERLAGFAPANDLAIMKLFTLASARFWRIKIVTAAIAPRLAVVCLGARLTLPYPPDNPFVPRRRKTITESSRSRNGHLLGVVMSYKEIKIKPKFSLLLRSWVDTMYEPFYRDHYSLKRPFFWAWDLTLYPEMVHLVVAEGDPDDALPVSMSAYYDAVELSMEGIEE